MSLRLIPRERAFDQLFVEQASVVTLATRLVEEDLREFRDPRAVSERLRELEHRGDDLNHAIVERLTETFVPPFDRHFVQELAGTLDDVLDVVEEVADLLVLYRVPAPPPGAADQAALLVRAADLLAEAMTHLAQPRELKPFAGRLHELERGGDAIVRELMQRLFDGATDVRPVLIDKDIYDRLEDALDHADRAGRVLERIASAYGWP